MVGSSQIKEWLITKVVEFFCKIRFPSLFLYLSIFLYNSLFFSLSLYISLFLSYYLYFCLSFFLTHPHCLSPSLYSFHSLSNSLFLSMPAKFSYININIERNKKRHKEREKDNMREMARGDTQRDPNGEVESLCLVEAFWLSQFTALLAFLNDIIHLVPTRELSILYSLLMILSLTFSPTMWKYKYQLWEPAVWLLEARTWVYCTSRRLFEYYLP